VKRSFIVDITDVKDEEISKIIEEKSKEVVLSIGKPEEPSIFRVIITFHQKT